MPIMSFTDNNITDSDFDLDEFNPRAIARNIASRMKKRRIELNITQQVLSEKAGISLGSLKRFETKFEISLKYLLSIAIVLDSTEEFNLLFSKQRYKNIDEVINTTQKKTRKRARNNV
jgi:transcriptional regulator with XRE-family HTH domain